MKPRVFCNFSLQMPSGSVNDTAPPISLSSIHCPNITRLINEYLASLSTEGNITLSVSDVTIPTTRSLIRFAEKTVSCMVEGSVLGLLRGFMLRSEAPDPAVLMAEEISQRNAVIYIVVVLFFYSFGIGIMMIKYMRKEAEEQEEFKMYRRYMSDTQDNYVSNPTSRSRLSNRLALNALNMINAIPQTSQSGSKVTFV